MLAAAVACAGLAYAAVNLSDQVRQAMEQNDFAGAARLVSAYRRSRGVTPEMLEAESWLARGELARRNTDQAGKYAEEVDQLCVAALKKRPLDRDPEQPLPIALGAAIEVQADVMALRGERATAVAYLRAQLQKYYGTSIRTRIQKNLNLLSLEGKAAPALQGAVLPKGKTVLLFFWAHWCPDCKAEAAVLRQVKSEFASRGLVLVAPTQKYGYVEGGQDATPQVETRYIEQIRQKYYAGVVEGPLLVNEENFRAYGASTTPTLVLVDRNGVVRMYHPGALSYSQLRARIAATL